MCVAWNRNPHITILFLGEVQEEYLDTILPLVLSITAEMEPFPFVLSGVGSFAPKLKQKSMSRPGPSPFWIGVEGGMMLQRLHHELATLIIPPRLKERSDRTGFCKSRFRPHLTLGRVKNGDSQIRFDGLPPFRTTEVIADRLCLYQSTLTPNGAEHRLHQEFFFRG